MKEIKRKIKALTTPQLGELAKIIDKEIEDRWKKQETSRLSKKDPRIDDITQAGLETYRQEFISCGKKSCKCARGELHGPYWYAYRRVKGKIRSKYIGAKLRIGKNSSEKFIGAIIELPDIGDITIEGFNDDGIAVRIKDAGNDTIKKGTTIYNALIGYYKLLQEIKSPG